MTFSPLVLSLLLSLVLQLLYRSPSSRTTCLDSPQESRNVIHSNTSFPRVYRSPYRSRRQTGCSTKYIHVFENFPCTDRQPCVIAEQGSNTQNSLAFSCCRLIISLLDFHILRHILRRGTVAAVCIHPAVAMSYQAHPEMSISVLLGTKASSCTLFLRQVLPLGLNRYTQVKYHQMPIMHPCLLPCEQSY